MAPALLFLPLGGLVADRGNPRRLLLRYHMLYAAPPLALAAVLMTGALSYPLLIAYGIAAGAIGAFAIPTRDALLPVVSKGVGLPRAVALATALQFIGQLLGIACASTADRFGAVPLLFAACRPDAGGVSRRAPAARSTAASTGRTSELLAQHRRRHLGGREVRPDLAGAADQFRRRHLLCRAVHGGAAAGRARQLCRRRARAFLRQSRLLGGHHRGQHGAGRPGAAAHAARAPDRRDRFGRRADPDGAVDPAAVSGVRGAELRVGPRRRNHA